MQAIGKVDHLRDSGDRPADIDEAVDPRVLRFCEAGPIVGRRPRPGERHFQVTRVAYPRTEGGGSPTKKLDMLLVQHLVRTGATPQFRGDGGVVGDREFNDHMAAGHERRMHLLRVNRRGGRDRDNVRRKCFFQRREFRRINFRGVPPPPNADQLTARIGMDGLGPGPPCGTDSDYTTAPAVHRFAVAGYGGLCLGVPMMFALLLTLACSKDVVPEGTPTEIAAPTETPAAPEATPPVEGTPTSGSPTTGIKPSNPGTAKTSAELYAECRDRVELPEVAGECKSDADCATTGCGSEICTAKASVEGLMTTCEDRPCFAALDVCGCQNGRCDWSLASEPQLKMRIPAPK